MKIITHHLQQYKIAEIVSDTIILSNLEDGLDLLGSIYFEDFNRMIIHEKNISPEFFDLKTKIAGDILQKFTQYQMPLIIIGDFSKYNSKSLNDFILESNKGQQVNFVQHLSEVIDL